MGQFAQGAAMPLPPAQAEAIYDLSLEDERIDGHEVNLSITNAITSGSAEQVRQPALALVTTQPEAMRDRGR